MGKITIASDVRSNDGPFPFFSRPERLGEYTLNRESVLTIGRADAKYLYNVSTQDEGVCMDLSKGFDSFEPKENDGRLDTFLQWITTQAPNGGILKKVLHECDFVSFRGLLTKIASSPYLSESWEFVALRQGGVIFFCERDTEEKKRRNLSISDREKMLTYWGFKFEQYVTTKERGIPPDTNSRVTCREEFSVVVQTVLAAPGGGIMRLVYSGEVDAIDEDGELVEIKTQQHAMVGHFWKQKSLKWWLQSFLIGIKNIVVGFRDNHGIVKKVGSVRTEDLPKKGQWSANACLNLLSSVLSTVRSQLSSDSLACVVRFDPIEKHISLQEEPFQDVDVLTQSFRSHFQLN